MGFEVKSNKAGQLFKDDSGLSDFEKEGFRTKSLDLSLPFGTTRGTQWFFDGIKMSYAESVLNEPVVLDWKGDTEMITMHFNLQGKVSILDKSMPGAFELAGNQHNMFYGMEAEGKMQVDELKMSLFLIQLSKKTFLKIASEGNDALKRFAESVEKGRSVALSHTSLNMDLNMTQCIHSVLNCRYADPLKQLFFFSKAIELMVLQAESVDRLSRKGDPYIKNEYDRERILFARDYLLKNMDCPPTLTGLSEIAGINEYKLKRGFKETFGQTVFGYLSEVRLETAKNDLLERKKTASEIAFELGYSSLQHFSAAFKKKFGISPDKARKM